MRKVSFRRDSSQITEDERRARPVHVPGNVRRLTFMCGGNSPLKLWELVDVSPFAVEHRGYRRRLPYLGRAHPR